MSGSSLVALCLSTWPSAPLNHLLYSLSLSLSSLCLCLSPSLSKARDGTTSDYGRPSPIASTAYRLPPYLTRRYSVATEVPHTHTHTHTLIIYLFWVYLHVHMLLPINACITQVHFTFLCQLIPYTCSCLLAVILIANQHTCLPCIHVLYMSHPFPFVLCNNLIWQDTLSSC